MTREQETRGASSAVDAEFANQFAERWFDAWNHHDVERSLTLYAPDFEQQSPSIVALANEPSGSLVGHEALSRHWRNVLAKYPNLHLEPLDVFLGVSSITLVYRINGRLGSETFHFNRERQVTKAYFHWAV